MSAFKSLLLIGIAMVCLSASIGDVVYQNSTGDDVMPITQYTYSLSSYEVKEMDGTTTNDLDNFTGELNIFADFKYEGDILANITILLSGTGTGSDSCLNKEYRGWYVLNGDMSDKDVEKGGSVTLKTLDGSSKYCDTYYEDSLASSGIEITFYHSSADKTIYRVEVNLFCAIYPVEDSSYEGRYVMVNSTFDLSKTVGTHGIYHPSETGAKETVAVKGMIMKKIVGDLNVYDAVGSAWLQNVGTVTDQDGKTVNWYLVETSIATSDGKFNIDVSDYFGFDEEGVLYTNNDVGIRQFNNHRETYTQYCYYVSQEGVANNVDNGFTFMFIINYYQDGTVAFAGALGQIDHNDMNTGQCLSSIMYLTTVKSDEEASAV